MARAAESIPIGKIIRKTEEGFDLVECFREEDQHLPADPPLLVAPRAATGDCRLSGALDEVTLDELASIGGDLFDVFELARPGPLSC